MIIPDIEYKKLFILKPIILLNVVVKNPLFPKKRMYDTAITIAGIVSGMLERDKRNFLPQKERFAQKKASGMATNIASNEEKKE